VTRQTHSNLFNGHTELSADMAIRFEKAFGIRADILTRMQVNYDIAQQASARADDQTTTHSKRTKRPAID
jgi:hypothetical protein